MQSVLSTVLAFVGIALVCGDDCGDYNPQIYICCNGILSVRPPVNAACCDTKSFSKDTHMCCNSIINPRPGETPQCCQSMAHDNEKYICCFGTSNPRPSNNTSCCNVLAIDLDTQICCDGVPGDRYPNTGCCGKVSFNADTHKCCSGSLVFPIGEDCPPTAFDPAKMMRKFAKAKGKMVHRPNDVAKIAEHYGNEEIVRDPIRLWKWRHNQH